MAKEIWKAGNMLYPLPVVMVSMADKAGKYNIITLAWVGTVCTNPPMVSISVRPERYSYSILKETEEFVINLATKELTFATDYCGVKSGREVDKFKEMNLTPLSASKVKAPLIKECPVNIECKVKQILPLGSHDMFLAEVLAVHADQKYIDEQHKFHLEMAEPIVYSHGAYLSCKDEIGSFGYSVRKKTDDKQINKKNTAGTKNHSKQSDRKKIDAETCKGKTLNKGESR